MRCRFCGSKSLHQDTQHKSFSAGKAAAGVAVLGVYGAAAGLIGKDQKGYRCGACGAFMDAPMDMITESELNQAVIAAQNGDRSMYDYYKRQYPHMEDVSIPTSKNTASTPEYIELSAPVTPVRSEDKEISILKHGYRDLVWDCDCPVYVESIYILTKEKQDHLKIDAVNVGEKNIRSVYFQASIFDDTGDKIGDKQCVFQNQAVAPGENLQEDTEFALNTDIAYRVQLVCEKVAFSDDSVWRKSETDENVHLQEQVKVSEGSFPRYKYLKKALCSESTYDYAKGIYLPAQGDTYWTCACGLPIVSGEKCPRCGFEYDRVEMLTSQSELRKRQKETIRSTASVRAKATKELYDTAHTEELEIIYAKAKKEQSHCTPKSLEEAAKIYESISEYKDSAELAKQCREEILVKEEEIRIQEEKRKEEIRKREEEWRIREEERRKEIEIQEKKKKKRKKTIITVILAAAIAVGLFYVCKEYIIPLYKYNEAQKLYDSEDYTKSEEVFRTLGEYKDSAVMSDMAHAEAVYQEVISLYDQKNLQSAYKKLKELKAYIETVIFPSDYEDSIRERASSANSEILYSSAEIHITNKDYENAVKCLKSIEGYKDYKDAKEKIEECETAIKDEQYSTAAALMESGDYEGAISAFEALKGYSDSADQIEVCKTAIKDNDYDAAVALMEEGDYEGAISAFKALDGYKDSKKHIKTCKAAKKDNDYDAAVALMEEGDYEGAITAFEALDGYKDSVEQIKACKKAELRNPKPGSEIIFGSFEQDNDTSNGKEEIEWLVLEVKDNTALVVSKFALDCRQYNDKKTSVTWADCSLRKWLNGGFMKDAFDVEETAMILETTVSAEKNSEYGTDPGNNTKDEVFLLSIGEVERLFSSDDKCRCKPTKYTKERGAYITTKGLCSWWLRSPGASSYNAAYISTDGWVGYRGYDVAYDEVCVRPAMWIDLGS